MKSAARQSKSTPGSTAPPAGPFAQHAPALAADGWAVFPLVPRDKTPYAGSHGHLDATTDQVQIERWTRIHANGNIGIRPAVGMLVVDIDSAALLAPWMNEHGLSLPPTRVVRTNRGSHYYYTFSSERPLLATIPGVDLKTSKVRLGSRVRPQIRPHLPRVARPPHYRTSGRVARAFSARSRSRALPWSRDQEELPWEHLGSDSSDCSASKPRANEGVPDVRHRRGVPRLWRLCGTDRTPM
ncbi:bifunctional DNA primase/polymerase [Rhodococcus sp. 3Y1]